MRLKHESRYLGSLEYDPADVYRFPAGLAGFPRHHRYLLTEPAETWPAKWLVSLEEDGPELALLDPVLLGEADRMWESLKPQALRKIHVDIHDDALVLCVLTVPDRIHNVSVNLRAPILLNPDVRLGVQCMLGEESRRPVRREIYGNLVRPDDPSERSGMIITHRKVNETLEIGSEITVRVLEIADGGVRLGVSAPKRVTVTRGRHAVTPGEENKRANEEMNVGHLQSLMRIFSSHLDAESVGTGGEEPVAYTVAG